MKIFLDNKRQASGEWVQVSWPHEAIALLETRSVSEISLDYDLGSDQRGTGYDVIRWIAAAIVNRGFIPPKISVHSSSGPARQRMEMGIKAIDACSAAFLTDENITGTAGVQALKPVLDQVLSHIDELYHHPDEFPLTGLSTGFIDLDRMTLGFQPGDLVVVAGRPLMGKTALALNIGEHVASAHGSAVAMFSTETGAAQLAINMLASVGMIDPYRLRTGKLQNEDWPKLTNALKKIESTAFHFVTPPFSSPRDICERARQIAHQRGELGLIIVDSIPLTPGHGEDRVAEISETSRMLKNLALELDCPVLAITELSQRLERRHDKRPTLYDLHNSGSLVGTADLILLMFREEVYCPDTSDAGTVQVTVSKQRNGPTGTVLLNFDNRYRRFANYGVELDGTPRC